jgi:hypothetical protein
MVRYIKNSQFFETEISHNANCNMKKMKKKKSNKQTKNRNRFRKLNPEVHTLVFGVLPPARCASRSSNRSASGLWLT